MSKFAWLRGVWAAVLLALAVAVASSWISVNHDPPTVPIVPATPAPLIAAAVLVLGGVLILLLRTQNVAWRWLVAGLLIAAVTPVALAGFWPNGQLGISDWDYYFSYHEVLRHMVLTFHTVPTWNPYICGGTAAVGDPEFPVFAPTFLLELALGVPIGLRAISMLVTAVGGIGTLVLARRLGFSVFGGLVAALVYAFGSVSLLEIVEGHPNVFSAMYLPWIFWAWLNAYKANAKHEIRNSKQIQSLKPVSSFGNSVLRIVSNFGIRFSNLWALLCAILLALTFFQGGIYLLMYTAGAFLFLIAVAQHRRAALTTTIAAGLWALGLAAVKLVPVLLWLGQFQDTAYASSALTLPYLSRILLGRYLHGIAEIIPGQGGGWHEYGAYIGPVVLMLALVAALRIRRPLVWKLWLAALIATLVSSTGPYLKPLFDQAPWLPRSNISRVMLFAVIPLGLLAGIGLDTVHSYLRRFTRRLPGAVATTIVVVLALGLLGITTLDLTAVSGALSEQAFVLDPDPHPLPPAAKPIAYTINDHRIRFDDVDYTRAYTSILAGYGTQSYCTVLGPDVAVKTVQHRDEDTSYVLVHGNTAGAATLVSWQPDEIVVRAVMAEPGDVVVNSNYVAGWTVNNTPARDIAGRLATSLPAGEHTLTFRYVAPGYRAGQLITLATAIAAAAILIGSRRRSDSARDTTQPPAQ